MNGIIKIAIIIAASIIIILIILFVLGKKRLKNEAVTDVKLEQLITDGKYVAAKCMIQSDIIYHDRVALGEEQEQHLLYLDSMVRKCNKKIKAKRIDERSELGSYIIELIPHIEHVDFTFTLDYCKPDINYQDSRGNTALMTAVRHKRTHIIRQLIEGNAQINAKDIAGKTALIIACEMGDYSMIKFLLEKGADIRQRDNSGKNILKQVNTDSEDYTRIISLLFESGADKSE